MCMHNDIVMDMQIWQKLLKLDYSNMQPMVCEDWYQTVRSILAARIGAVVRCYLVIV